MGFARCLLIPAFVTALGSPVFAVSEPADPLVAPQPAICTREYRPVCAKGPRGVRTYPNAGVAKGDGARLLYQGTCRKR